MVVSVKCLFSRPVEVLDHRGSGRPLRQDALLPVIPSTPRDALQNGGVGEWFWVWRNGGFVACRPTTLVLELNSAERSGMLLQRTPPPILEVVP